MTRVETQILTAVIENGGLVKSLFAMSIDLGIDYSHAWRCINRLEKKGVLRVGRKAPGAPLVIAVAAPIPLPFLQNII